MPVAYNPFTGKGSPTRPLGLDASDAHYAQLTADVKRAGALDFELCWRCNDTLDTKAHQDAGEHPFCGWATDAEFRALMGWAGNRGPTHTEESKVLALAVIGRNARPDKPEHIIARQRRNGLIS